MAPELAWDELPDNSKRLRVLDPMSGSGTTLVAARLRGHQAIGFDRDPLAVLIAKTWISNIDSEVVEKKAAEVLERARKRRGFLRNDLLILRGQTKRRAFFSIFGSIRTTEES